MLVAEGDGRKSRAMDRSCADRCAIRTPCAGTSAAVYRYMLMPTVSRFMTREPYRISSTASLEEARSMMTTHGIRHLPVMEGDKLLGVVAETDVRIVQAVPGVDLAHIEISRVLTAPVCVWGETSLDEVADVMAQKKCDCVVVLGGQGVQGIFTSSDALGALGAVLERATL